MRSGLSLGCDRVRERRRSGEPGRPTPAGSPGLSGARGPQHPVCDHLSGQGSAPGGGVAMAVATHPVAHDGHAMTQSHSDVTRDVVATLGPPTRGYVLLLL